MCGISGSVHRDPAFRFPENIGIAVRDTLVHRGPDDAGHFAAPGVFLGSRRLSILDLSSNGHMPMTTPDGRFVIVYNGEVYNYRDLKRNLHDSGVHLKSNSDTEVVLHLYAEHGPQMLSQLNGMFAFAIWDTLERQLFVARDRLGVKPLYYAQHNGILHFASEIKALFAAGVPQIFDPEAWPELLTFRYVAGSSTSFKGVHRLLPGHYMIWKNGEVQISRWWSLADRVREKSHDIPKNAYDWFREIFDDSVNLRRISDVPVGVLLSGGLDSGSVAASLAMQAGKEVASFTVRFEVPRFDEGMLARRVAHEHGLDYHELTVRPSDLPELLVQASQLSDEPLVHLSDVHLFAISRFAKSRVTVLLSGEGADELLGGYVRYQPLRYPAFLKLARPLLPLVTSGLKLNGRFRKLERLLEIGSIDQCTLFNSSELSNYSGFLKHSFPYRWKVLEEAKSLYPSEPFRQAMHLDLHTYLCSLLDRNDRMTMGASIECRVPFLDYRIVEGLCAMPSSKLLSPWKTKHLLRKALGSRLPSEILTHKKWGFAVPWPTYIREVPELRDRVGRLHRLEPVTSGFFEERHVKTIVERFLNGDTENESLITHLFMIGISQEAGERKAADIRQTAVPHL